jgi:peptide/nickel transport system substrate-binding protein
MTNTTTRSPRRWLLLAALLLIALVVYFSLKPKVSPGPDVLNIQMNALPKTLNPFMTSSGATSHLASRIMLTLGVFDADSSTLQPVLVKAIPSARVVTEGPQKGLIAYDFEMLEEARWDNGTPITGHDLEFTFKLLFLPGIPEMDKWKGYFNYVKAVQVDAANPKKFSIYISQPYILAITSFCQIPILPAYAYDAAGNLKSVELSALLAEKIDSQLVVDPHVKAAAEEFRQPKYGNDLNVITGCGAYKVTQLTEQLVTLTKKENWWGGKLSKQYPYLAAYPKVINYILIREEPVIETMLKTRELDLVYNPNPTKFKAWQQDKAINEFFNFETRWAPSYNRLLLNLTNPKLSDKRVRQAIAYSINYDNLVNHIFEGYANRIVGPVHSTKPYYGKTIPLYQFDIAKAKALLAEAGWKDSNGNGIVDKNLGDGKVTELSINLLATTAQQVVKDMTESIRETARQAGIDFVVVALAPEPAIKATILGDYEAYLGAAGLNTGLDDFFQQYHSSNFAPNGDNRSRFSNASLDSLTMAIRVCPDAPLRNKMYNAAQEILHEEVPEVYLFSSVQRYIVAKKLKYVLSTERPGFYEYLFQLK